MRRRDLPIWIVILILFSCVRHAWADPQDPSKPATYQRALESIRRILDAPPPPNVSLDPTRRYLLLVQGVRYPPIAELAQPMLRLAGLRLNPRTNGLHGDPHFVGITLRTISDGQERKISLPPDAKLGIPRWSPNGEQFAFTNTVTDEIELWIATARTGEARKIQGLRLNASYGEALEWMPDSQTLLCQLIPEGRGEPPVHSIAPLGPYVQESSGKSGPVRTYQDLLDDPHEEQLFEYYATSQLALVRVSDGQATKVGQPALVSSTSISPDGTLLLSVTTHRPFSYLHPANLFPKEIAVRDLNGGFVHHVARLPLQDQIPIEGVPTGPRNVHWRPTEPATLVWTEALDGGDPRTKVPHRDRVLLQRMPARLTSRPLTFDPVELARTEHRLMSLVWAARNDLALLRDYDRDRRWVRTFLVRADRPGETGRLVWDHSIQERYANPGTPLMRTLPNGHRVLWQNGDSIFLDGDGATPQGDRPFLDRFDLVSLKSERLFRCDERSFESVVALISDDGSQFITRRETPVDPPNYFLHTLGDASPRAMTQFPDPAPELRGIQKQLVTYQRSDGVPLSFTLYRPPGSQPNQPLPTLVWAYPREFNDASTAGQVTGSTNQFTTLTGISHLFLLLAGYAVLDGASMPVVGTPETMNDTYVRQIVDSAQAAIDKAVEMGVTDRDRVGVGGHSYGAFMTANLLAHCDLFRAGIARSGAYNRTLTPFGFQSERRTLWEAPETYATVSPFMVAHRIKEPLLLIHGEADDNSGTFPIQSERMYQAVRGNGGTVRLVILPHESHAYRARESVEHTLYEMIQWFDRHVKPLPARVGGG